MSAEAMKYRADIDGLRAIAVISVILAHAGVGAVGGGFLGVDMFFVISGYLITTILRRDMEAGRYTLLGFYERRARRILPALLIIILCCTPFALYLMLPDFRQNYGQSIVATLLFSNNILLAMTSGYWELESAFKPLLHTWSLGVEEQFYVLFPLLLVLLIRLDKRRQVLAIALIGVASFVASEYGWRHHPAASFYLLSSRAWELMVGCLGSYIERKPRAFDPWLSFVSLVLLVGSMCVFDEHTPSPSLYSAVPVLGTIGVILFSRPGTLTWRLLSLRPIVFIGLISYSAYLWHQPLFALARVASLQPPSGAEMAALSVATLLLAALSWRFVEVPFRRAATMPLRRFVPIVLAGTVLLLAIGMVLHVKQGFPRWTFPNIAHSGDVLFSYNERIRRYSTGAFPDNGRANYLLVGNSYGRDAGNLLLEAGVVENRNLVYVEGYPDTPAGRPVSAEERRLYATATMVIVALFDQDAREVARIGKVLSGLTAAPVVFIGSKNFGYNINPFGRVPMRDREASHAAVPGEMVRANDALVRALPAAQYLDLIRLLGTDGRHIRFFDDAGNPMTPDRRHLTRYGALYLAARLRERQPAAWRTIETGVAQ